MASNQETSSSTRGAGGLRLAAGADNGMRGKVTGAKMLTVVVFAVICLFLVWDLYDAAVERSPSDPHVGVTISPRGDVRGSTVTKHDSSAFATPTGQSGEPTTPYESNAASPGAPADTNPHVTTIRVP